MERLQSVVKILLDPEQNCTVKGRTVQSNLRMPRMILEGVEDVDEAALINLDKSKAFDRVEHHYLAAVLHIAGFKPDLQVDQLAVAQVNGKRPSALSLSRLVRQGCLLSPLL